MAGYRLPPTPQNIDYPSFHQDKGGVVNVWQKAPGGGIDPAAASIRGGYYQAAPGPYEAAVNSRREPEPNDNPQVPVLAPRPRFMARQGSGDVPNFSSGVVGMLGYNLGRAGSIVEPTVQGPGHVRSFTGGGGFPEAAVGGGSNVGGGAVPTTQVIGTHTAGVPVLPTAPGDHIQGHGSGVVAPVGSGGPGVFTGGGTGAVTNEPWAHRGFGMVERRRTGPVSVPGGPVDELSKHQWFGLPGEAPLPEGLSQTEKAGGAAGVTLPAPTRPTRKPSNVGSAYHRPFDIELGSVPNNGAKVVVKTGSPAYGPNGQNAGIDHAATTIMVSNDSGSNKFPGYSGGVGAPAGMTQTGYRRNSWRLQPQPWDTFIVDGGTVRG